MFHLFRLFSMGAALLVLGVAPAARAQIAPAWQSALTPTQTTGNSRISSTAVEAGSGAVFVTGDFSGQIAFGSTVLTSVGGRDVFVARYNPGTASWAWATSGGGSGADYGYGIAVDSGGVYTTGYFQNSGTFAGQPVLSGTGQEVFVAAYAASDGTGRWATSGGGPGLDVGAGIVTDGRGGVYVTGYFTTRGTFAGQPALSGSGQELFVAAYAAADGRGRWATSSGGSGTDYGYGIATDGQGGVYVTGTFQNSGTFAGQPALSGSGTEEVFVAAYAAADGRGRWAKSGGGPNNDSGTGIAADGQGGVYVTGTFQNSGTFAGQPALSGTDYEVFVAAYAAADGSGRWARSGGGSGPDVGTGIAVDGRGGVYTTGFFSGSGTFAGQPALSGLSFEVFVAAYAAADGSGRWATSGGGPGSDSGLGIATDGTHLYLGGGVGLPATFGALTLAGSSREIGALAGLRLPATLATGAGLPATPIALYPNPAGGGAVRLALPVPAGTLVATATVLNALGQVVRAVPMPVVAGEATGTLSTAGLAAGVYLLRLKAGTHTASRRLVVD